MSQRILSTFFLFLLMTTKSYGFDCKHMSEDCSANAKCYTGRILMTCTDGRRGFVDDRGVPDKISAQVFVPFGQGIKGGTFKNVEILNTKKFTLSDLASEKDEVRNWMKENQIFAFQFSKITMGLPKNTPVFQNATGDLVVDLAATPNSKYRCFWVETPMISRAKCANSQPVCSGKTNCTDVATGVSSVGHSSCMESTAGKGCQSASACASADDVRDILMNSCVASGVRDDGTAVVPILDPPRNLKSEVKK